MSELEFLVNSNLGEVKKHIFNNKYPVGHCDVKRQLSEKVGVVSFPLP